jgi:adenine deaminase
LVPVHAFTRGFLGEVDSSIGTAIGIGVGVAVVAIVATILAVRHFGHANDGVLINAGWQFDLILQNPLTLNAASVAESTSDF